MLYENCTKSERRNFITYNKKVCKSGTVIHFDCWAVYQNIEQNLRFQHETVNHKLYFVDSNSGAHTQKIVSFWN